MGQLLSNRSNVSSTTAASYRGRTQTTQSQRDCGDQSHLYRPSYLWQIFKHRRSRGSNITNRRIADNFPDLNLLPPEIGLEVLKNLDATDLCLAACVWSDLANDEILWEGLCKNSWGHCSAYRNWKEEGKSFKKLYLLLDEGCLTFNAEPAWGIQYLIRNDVLLDDPMEIALFFNSTNQLCWQRVRQYLNEKPDVLDELIKLQSFKNQFLPNALRKFFQAIDSPISRGEYLNLLIDKFAERFCNDNPDLNLVPEIVSILCFSLILLSVDLTSPQVKNKMSKREFVRNVRSALGEYSRNELRIPPGQALPPIQPEILARREAINAVDSDFAGHLYDNIYLVGHIAPQRWKDDD